MVTSGTTCELTRRELDVNLVMRISATAGPSVDPGVTRQGVDPAIEAVGPGGLEPADLDDHIGDATDRQGLGIGRRQAAAPAPFCHRSR